VARGKPRQKPSREIHVSFPGGRRKRFLDIYEAGEYIPGGYLGRLWNNLRTKETVWGGGISWGGTMREALNGPKSTHLA